MPELVRWEPFRELASLRDWMDRLWSESFWRPFGWLAPGETVATLALDIFESDDEVTVRALLPGVRPEEVEISVTGGVLTIHGEEKEEKEEKKGSYHLRERRYGAFRRSIQLPVSVNAEKAEASLKDGVLTVTLPKKEEARPKRIQVKTK